MAARNVDEILKACLPLLHGVPFYMKQPPTLSVFDWRGPSQATAAEKAAALNLLNKTRKVGHMSKPIGDVFSPPITTRAQADRTNSIRGVKL